MTDKIEPALTLEEWAAAPNTVYLRDVLRDCADSAMSFEGDHFLVKAMAVANAALPDNDPRKITHDDIRLLEGAASNLRAEADDEWPLVERLAAKLAAFLPPSP